jgi:hypothetical protein
MIHKSVSTKTELTSMDERILHIKYAIRSVAGSKEKWFGLDTSTMIKEYVPLITSYENARERITRVS